MAYCKITCVYAKVIISLRQPLPSSLGPFMISPASARMDHGWILLSEIPVSLGTLGCFTTGRPTEGSRSSTRVGMRIQSGGFRVQM